MTRPGKSAAILAAMAFQALMPATRWRSSRAWSAGFAAFTVPEVGNWVKMTPSTPSPGASITVTARRSSAV
jgi:hypothetical protein